MRITEPESTLRYACVKVANTHMFCPFFFVLCLFKPLLKLFFFFLN